MSRYSEIVHVQLNFKACTNLSKFTRMKAMRSKTSYAYAVKRDPLFLYSSTNIKEYLRLSRITWCVYTNLQVTNRKCLK